MENNIINNLRAVNSKVESETFNFVVDGSSPLQLNCPFCKKNFNSKNSFSNHIRRCKDNPNRILEKNPTAIKCECEWCKEEFFSKKALKEHLILCSKRIKYNSLKHNNWKCNYCEEIFSSRRKLEEHNKETHKCRKKHSNQFIKAKENGIEIKSKIKGRVSTFKGKHHSIETKEKLSKIMKEKIKNGEFIVPYKRNHSSKISYPEKYFMDILKDIKNLKYNYQVGLYQLDFALPDKKIYIEIDGEQHYVDKKIVEHDIKRTEKLNNLGWVCLKRIRWSEYKKMSQIDKENFCEKIINLIVKYEK